MHWDLNHQHNGELLNGVWLSQTHYWLSYSAGPVSFCSSSEGILIGISIYPKFEKKGFFSDKVIVSQHKTLPKCHVYSRDRLPKRQWKRHLTRSLLSDVPLTSRTNDFITLFFLLFPRLVSITCTWYITLETEEIRVKLPQWPDWTVYWSEVSRLQRKYAKRSILIPECTMWDSRKPDVHIPDTCRSLYQMAEYLSICALSTLTYLQHLQSEDRGISVIWPTNRGCWLP